MLRPSDMLGDKYRVKGLIGEGSFGRVYRAEEVALGRDVAIKELLKGEGELGSSDYAQFSERFRREARVQAQFNHPNIVHVYELLEPEPGTMYLVMEYVDGPSLRDYLAKRGPLPVDEAVGISSDILQGLAAVHSHAWAIVHRDVKPSNILLTSQGEPKLADFGLAQVLDESMRSQRGEPHPGTQAYMSPEQAETTAYLYPPSDLFSLGCILFEMLSGVPYRQAQHSGKSLRDLRPNVPTWLEKVVAKSLAEDGRQRYQTAEELAAALTLPGPVPSAEARPEPPPRTMPVWGWGCAGAAGLGAAAAGGAVLCNVLSRREFLKEALVAATAVATVPSTLTTALVSPDPGATPRPTEAPTPTVVTLPTLAPTPTPPPPDRVSIRLMVMDYDENMKPDTQAVIDAFNASQDEIEATLDVVSWGQGHDLLVTQISGGQPPDLCNVSAQWGGEWEGIDEVMPLGDYVSKEFLAGFVPAMVAAFTNKDGQVMGLPYFLDPRPMYYRKDLFEAEGLAAPDTWDDVIAAGEALQNPPDMTGYGQTFSMKSDGLDYWWYAWFGVIGCDGDLSVWTDDGHNKFGTPEAIKATQYVVDLTQKYKITNSDYTTAGRDEELQPLFYAGKLAMLITGSWFPTLIANNAPDMVYDLGMPPVAEAGITPATGVWPDSVLMFKQTKHPEAAGKLLEFMFNAENRMDFAKQRGVIPELVEVGQDPAYAVSDTEKFMVAMLDYSHNVYETPWPGTYYKTFVEVETQIGRAVAGEITAEEAMKSSAEYVDKANGL